MSLLPINFSISSIPFTKVVTAYFAILQSLGSSAVLRTSPSKLKAQYCTSESELPEIPPSLGAIQNMSPAHSAAYFPRMHVESVHLSPRKLRERFHQNRIGHIPRLAATMTGPKILGTICFTAITRNFRCPQIPV